MNTDIQIYTHDTPKQEFLQLGYLYPSGTYKKNDTMEWFKVNETLSVDAVGINIPTDQEYVDLEKIWFLVE
jgi:hypothetical protein